MLRSGSKPLHAAFETVRKEYDPAEPRDLHGRWSRIGGAIPTIADCAPMAGKLPSLPWVAPPPPEGKPGGHAGGWSGLGISNTRLGDAVEAALKEYGLTPLNEHRQGPLDLRDATHAFEVKAMTTAAAEYKAKPKAREMTEKRREARRLGLEAAMMLVVVRPDGLSDVYWREGVGAYRINERMHYAGRINVRL